ncbi:hypothetical protein FHG64_18530 [Antarcticibacterium flavum]|uniref:DUF3379 domain-containing protein n=1 Tax=Antarcticibacterium flavum TaxID=2058175 RepID=A0A5B7X6W1_9FLAO|nr:MULTISPECIES: hypothetical protein [Antarcticibacterium]MCM4160621.1 hypothetical protein [Antarcticibacterium sp. W02-3]QCY71226.1 hypothetical protein FHG64_18530 [Antarcticibacterium flavum]
MKRNKLPYSQKSGFQVPENYFQDLEDRIMNKVTNDESSLEYLKGQSGFVVPQDYFEQFEGKVIDKLGLDTPDKKVIPLWKKKKFYYTTAVAAVFIAIISTVLFNPVLPDYTMENIELAAFEEYIDRGYIDLNFNEISAFITEEGYAGDSFNTAELSDEEMLDYLNENVEDPELLFD